MFKRQMGGLIALLAIASGAMAADKEVHGKIIKADHAKMILSVETDDGRKDFTFANDTKIKGPKGDASDDGLKDHRLVPGATVKLVVAGNNRTLREVHLLAVKGEAKPKAEKPNTKEKETGEVKGRVIKFDSGKKTLTVMTEAGKREFGVGADTKVIDPHGKMSHDGLKDDRLVAGAEVELILSPGGKGIKEIQLAATHPAGSATHPAKEDKPSKPSKEAEGTPAKIVKVDAERKILTVMTENGKKMEFSVDHETKFIGPRDGISREGMEDDRLVAGAEVRLVLGSGKTLKEVHLPYRPRKDQEKDK